MRTDLAKIILMLLQTAIFGKMAPRVSLCCVFCLMSFESNLYRFNSIIGCLAPADAWFAMKDVGAIATEDRDCVSYGSARGFCIGTYTSTARNAVTNINVDAPEYSSPLLFNELRRKKQVQVKVQVAN